MSIHSLEAIIEEGSVISESTSDEITVPIDFGLSTKELELPASSVIQELLYEHKGQSEIVQAIKDEITNLQQNPAPYFQDRKKFLYHAYIQTLKDYQGKVKWEVKIDSAFAITDEEIGLVFGHIYQMNPRDALKATFTMEKADEVNQQAAKRVQGWQSLDSLPESHNANLVEIGKRIVKGHVGVLDSAVAAPIIKDTGHLLKEVKALENEEQRLKNEFPAAIKIIGPSVDDPAAESPPRQSTEEVHENGHESEKSESSGVLVEQHDCEEAVEAPKSTELKQPSDELAEPSAEIPEDVSPPS